MLLAVLSVCSREELNDSDSDDEGGQEEDDEAALAGRSQQIKNKILAVGRMQRVFQILRCVVSSLCVDILLIDARGAVRKRKAQRNLCLMRMSTRLLELGLMRSVCKGTRSTGVFGRLLMRT